MSNKVRKRNVLTPVVIMARSQFKVLLPMFLVLVISASLWLAPSAQALTIEITPTSGTGTLEKTYTFTIRLCLRFTMNQTIQLEAYRNRLT